MSPTPQRNQQLSAYFEQASNQDEEYIVDNMSATSNSKAIRQSQFGTFSEQSSKRQRNSESAYTELPYRSQADLALTPQSFSSFSSTRSAQRDMSDGKNEARAIRVLEIMNDFRTLQQHITAQVTRTEATPPDQSAYYLDGFVILRQANAEAQAILSKDYNPGSLGLESAGRVPDTEVQKATLQRQSTSRAAHDLANSSRVILDASTRRFQAHKIYLRASAAMRWVLARRQVGASNKHTAAQKQQAAQVLDQRLQTELSNITDESVVNDLRSADLRKTYWVEEDPSLERMLAWIRRQR